MNTDDGTEIQLPKETTLATLLDLQERTGGRFNFDLHSSGLFATCRYVNYEKDSRGHRVRLEGTKDNGLLGVETEKRPFITTNVLSATVVII